MSDKVAIIGVGQSAFVRGFPGSIRELAYEGFKEAMQDAKLEVKDIDASLIASAPEYDRQRSPAGVIAEYLGLIPQPTCYIETVCSSSSTGVLTAYSMIKAGLYDTVAVVGFQKMSEISSMEVQERMGRGADIQWESPFGTMMPAYYAMYARAYMDAHGLTLDDLRTDVARHDQDDVLEVHVAPEAVRQPPFFHYLKKHVEDLGVRLLDLVKQHDGVRPMANLLGQLPAFLVTNVPWRSANETRDIVLLHVFAHVYLDERVLLAEHELRQRPGK